MTHLAEFAAAPPLLSQVPVALYQRRLDASWTAIFFSDFIETITGYTAADLTAGGRYSWAELIEPENRVTAALAIKSAIAQQQPFSVEYRIQHADGSWCWVCDRGQAVYGEDGRVEQLSGVLFDVTAGKQSSSLEQSELTNRALINAFPDLMLRMQRDSATYEILTSGNVNVVCLNPEQRRASLSKVLPPDQVDKRLHFVRQALDTGTLQIYEQSFVREGRHRWEEVRVLPWTADEVLVMVRDICDRKQIEAELHRLNHTLESRIEERTRALRASERDLRTLFDSIHEGILIHDTQGKILDVNRTLLKMYGLTRQEMLKASLKEDLFSPDQPVEILRDHWQQALTGTAQLFDWKARRPKDGTLFDAEIYLQRITLRERQVILVNIRDISERKRVEAERQQAEQAMRTSRQFLQLVMDNIPQAIFWKDHESVYLGCNQVFAQAAGLADPSDIIGKTDYDLPWTQTEAEDYRANDHRVMASGKGEYHLLESQIRADGSHIWCDTNKVPLFGSDSHLVGLLGTYEDITDRIRAEEALRESKQLLQLVMDNIPQSIFWKDRNLVYLGCNQNFARTAGLQTPAEIIGKTDYDLPWTSEQAEEYRLGDRTVMETNTPILGKLEIQQQADGSHVWLETNKVPLYNAEGAVVGVLGTLEDITERKQAVDLLKEQVRLSSLQAEIDSILTRGEPLQAMLQACTDALVKTLDIAFARVWTLSSTETVLELQASSGLYTHLDGYHSRIPVGQFKVGRIAEQRCPQLSNSIQSDPWISDPAWAKQEGMVAFAGYPLIVEDQLLGVIGMFARQPLASSVEDLLALLANEIALGIKRKQTEVALSESESQLRQRTQALETTLQELQRAQMQLVQSEKMSSLGQLVAGVAHEINNPVNFIYGNLNHARNYIEDLMKLVELYQHSYPDPLPAIAAEVEAIDLPFVLKDLPKLLNSMKVGADRIQKIVMSLRTFSRMDEAEQKAVDIHAGLDSTLMILQSRLKASGGRPTIEVIQRYGQIPPIECYAGQLNQVFMNILSNAIDALEEAWEDQPNLQPEIILETSLTPTDVVIVIADNGPGIAPETQRRLFDPFFTTKPIGKGTGMGLSISYQIVTERHQGSLTCQSVPGQGTAFTIAIPYSLLD
ncbi:PAS domain S-box protein [Pseudanabaena sp. FACHB-2040]|uniref:PAS domain S-box protein n=1 Tax=Pseudanabaena sp. FACHB-2040 TaxID=2692859 RepID=UPI00168262E9|nr:PAS domain S-box protein [Pseudanabaena sp. FACHB-2040]MBD2259248.1 PAS domain S-box protein [Pseudanabaena sp. FACHB-2040]